jgi:hypothetical protein
MPAGWVSAGVAAVGAVSSIAANQSAASAAKKNNATAAQLAGAQGTMLNEAQAVSQQPFQAYTGTMTAPMSGNQQQAVSQASKVANDGTAQADNTAATGLIGQVANNGFSGDTINKYMSPYTQAVTDTGVAAANKAYTQQLAGIQTGAAGSGAFGGSREAIAEATAASNNNINVGTLTAKGNADAYNSAINTWQADNATKLNAAQAYENAGQDVTAMNSTQISDLLKTGGVSQVIAQTDLTNQYNEFMRQQNWSAQQLSPLINAVSVAKGSPTQTPAIQSNTANQLMGLGSTVAGLFGGGGGSSSPDAAFASGGSVSNAATAASAPSFDFSDIGNSAANLDLGSG